MINIIIKIDHYYSQVIARIVFDLQRSNTTIGDINAEEVTAPTRLVNDTRENNSTEKPSTRLNSRNTSDLENTTTHGNDVPTSSSDTLIANIVQRLQVQFTSLSETTSSKPLIVLIDDNMYYRSMRHAYYRMSWSLRCCYLVVYLQVEFDVALQRNAKRTTSNRQSDEVMRSINSAIEPPPAYFERHYLPLDGAQTWDHSTMEVLGNSLTAALLAPIPRPSTPVVKRGEPLPDTLGQRCDLVVRRLIAARIEGAIKAEQEVNRTGDQDRLCVMDKEARKIFSKKLAARKCSLLKSIKSGKFSGLDTMTPSELYEFLDSHLVSYLLD